MIKTYEDWAAMDDLYMLLHTYVSDNLLKQLFDAGKKAGIELEQKKHKWIPITEKLPDYDESILWECESGYILYDCLSLDDDIEAFMKGTKYSGKVIAWKKEEV